jgi:hypothetical protein
VSDILWVAFCLALLVIPAVIDCRRINRRRDNGRAIDAERMARENAAPLGNVDRVL